MTTIVMVLATMWAVGAVLFFGAVCLAAKRPMPMPETSGSASSSMLERGVAAEYMNKQSIPSQSSPLIAAATRC